MPEFGLSFDPVKPHLVFEVEGRGRAGGAEEPGWIEIEGKLDRDPILGTELRFVPSTDRSRLAGTTASIRGVLERFPNRGPKTL